MNAKLFALGLMVFAGSLSYGDATSIPMRTALVLNSGEMSTENPYYKAEMLRDLTGSQKEALTQIRMALNGPDGKSLADVIAQGNAAGLKLSVQVTFYGPNMGSRPSSVSVVNAGDSSDGDLVELGSAGSSPNLTPSEITTLVNALNITPGTKAKLLDRFVNASPGKIIEDGVNWIEPAVVSPTPTSI